MGLEIREDQLEAFDNSPILASDPAVLQAGLAAIAAAALTVEQRTIARAELILNPSFLRNAGNEKFLDLMKKEEWLKARVYPGNNLDRRGVPQEEIDKLIATATYDDPTKGIYVCIGCMKQIRMYNNHSPILPFTPS